jgi:hypothetical protein
MGKTLFRIVLRVAMAGVLVAVLTFCAPAKTRAAVVAPPDGYGFGNGAAMQLMSGDEIDRELDAVSKTSASWLRVLIDWSRIEYAKSKYNWDYLDRVVAAANGHGLKMLGVITYAPEWARPGDTYFTGPPNDAADYADFATAVTARYGGQISNWELWNEPNLWRYWGKSDIDAAWYTRLVVAAYPAIKRAQPASTVVLGGLSRFGAVSPPDFMEQVYAAGGGGSFDAAAMHPYVFPGGLAADSNNGWSYVGGMHDVMSAHGDAGKKIWMTELGAPTSDDKRGVSQDEQAKQITDVLAASAATGYSGPAFVYSIRDVNTNDRGENDANTGALLTSDWQPKATAAVLAK